MRIDAAYLPQVAFSAWLLVPIQWANVAVYLGCAVKHRSERALNFESIKS